MAMWATFEDVRGRWVGDDVPEDYAKMSRWVDDAERLIVSEIPDLADRIDADPALVESVRFVVAHMVMRAWRNPDGLRQFNEQTGPLGLSGTFAGKNPGGLGMTDDERALLGGASSRGRPRAFTISPVVQPPVPPSPWT